MPISTDPLNKTGSYEKRTNYVPKKDTATGKLPENYDRADHHSDGVIEGDLVTGKDTATHKKLFVTTVEKHWGNEGLRADTLMKETKARLDKNFPGAWKRGIDTLMIGSKWSDMYLERFGEAGAGTDGKLNADQAEKLLTALIVGFSMDIAEDKSAYSEYFSSEKDPSRMFGTKDHNKDGMLQVEGEMTLYGYKDGAPTSETQQHQFCVPMLGNDIDIDVITKGDDQVQGSFSGDVGLTIHPRQPKGDQFIDNAVILPEDVLAEGTPPKGVQMYKTGAYVRDYTISLDSSGQLVLTLTLYSKASRELQPTAGDVAQTLTLKGRRTLAFLKSHKIGTPDRISDTSTKVYSKGLEDSAQVRDSIAFTYINNKINGYLEKIRTDTFQNQNTLRFEVKEQAPRAKAYLAAIKAYLAVMKQVDPAQHKKVMLDIRTAYAKIAGTSGGHSATIDTAQNADELGQAIISEVLKGQ